MTTLLSTALLEMSFGGNRALGPVDFRAEAGKIVGLISPNGSGKTTFFNVVTGFLRPSAGQVFWKAQDIIGLRPSRRAGMGLVRTFQEKMVFFGLSVSENICFAFIQHGVKDLDSGAVENALDYVGLPHAKLNQQAGDLSWGQCRLLGTALGLILKPKLLLLDEPFVGLNRIAAVQVTQMLTKLRGDGIGAVIVEHEMSLLLPLCDRVVVFSSGRMLAEGSSEDILKRDDARAAYFGADIDARN